MQILTNVWGLICPLEKFAQNFLICPLEKYPIYTVALILLVIIVAKTEETVII